MEEANLVKAFIKSLPEGDWESYLSADFSVQNCTLDETIERAQYVQAARAFYSTTTSAQIEKMLVQGDTVATIIKYELRSPFGKTMPYYASETYTVRDGKLTHLILFLDRKTYMDFMSS